MSALNGNGDFGSRPHKTRYELVDKDGRVVGRYPTLLKLHQDVSDLFPDQHQDEDHTGKGWDIQVCGCE